MIIGYSKTGYRKASEVPGWERTKVLRSTQYRRLSAIKKRRKLVDTKDIQAAKLKLVQDAIEQVRRMGDDPLKSKKQERKPAKQERETANRLGSS